MSFLNSMINYRISFLSMLVLVLSNCSEEKSKTDQGPVPAQRPNIIYIMTDDHTRQAISAYGSVINKTPNIDRIAREGMRFDNCFVTNSICAPSRATILTGKYSHLNGVTDNIKDFDGSQQTYPKILQAGGYETAMIGKWHLKSAPTGFDYWEVLPGQGQYYNPEFIKNGDTVQYTGYVTDIITDKALDWLDQRNTGKPFLLVYQHKAPHRKWLPGPDHLTLYDDQEIPIPETFFDKYEGRGTAAREQELHIMNDMHLEWDNKNFTFDELEGMEEGYAKRMYTRMNEQQRKDWADAYYPEIEAFRAANLQGDDLAKWKYQRYIKDYLRCVASVDDNLGRLLDYLDSTGLSQNTVVVYTSDQGFYLGEHGWFDKRFMYEESFSTPLMVKWPGVVTPGSVNSDLVSNLDFAETFLDIAGLPIPEDMQGQSMLPLLQSENTDWRESVYYHYYEYPGVHAVKRHYGVRTNRYKLIHFYYDIDEWELYDLKNDPSELQNVYEDPEYLEIRAEMHQELEKAMVKYGDGPDQHQAMLVEDGIK